MDIETLPEEKRLLRRKMLRLRLEYPADQAAADSRILQQKLLEMDVYKQARTVLCFVSCRNEPETRPILMRALSDGKKLGVPKIESPACMRFLRIQSLEDLTEGSFGIMEPREYCREELTEGFVITPGLAFDRKMGRLGYGGSFYDTWFAAHSSRFISCGIAYDFQLLDEVPCGPHDWRVDQVLTPGGLFS